MTSGHDNQPFRLDLRQVDWRIIDDGIMGGRSHGLAVLRDGALLFHGELSTANGGGFSSVRGQLPTAFDMGRLSGFRLRVEGDGRTYQFRLRDSDSPRAIAFRGLFRTGPEPATIDLPVGQFEPVLRGRTVEVLPPLTQRSICYLGFMLNSDCPGPFRLLVTGIEAVFQEPRHVDDSR